MKHDIRKLDEKINRLSKSISELATLPPGFGTIIHKPGFTSIAEFALVEAGIDSLQAHILSATEHCKQLMKAADMVGVD